MFLILLFPFAPPPRGSTGHFSLGFVLYGRLLCYLFVVNRGVENILSSVWGISCIFVCVYVLVVRSRHLLEVFLTETAK